MTYYLARRHLHMSPPEWDALPWWEQKMYLEGYVDEGLVETGPPQSPARPGEQVTDQRVHHEGGTTITETDSQKVLSGVTPGEFATFGGIRERNI